MVENIKKSSIIAVWFIFLSFPLVVLRVDYIDKTIDYRWHNILWIGIGAFFISWVWRYFLKRKNESDKSSEGKNQGTSASTSRFQVQKIFEHKFALLGILIAAAIVPQFMSTYQTSIFITAMMYVVLGLGLNIVVGMAGLLDLGYVAFYAVGAYTYGLLNLHFGLGFWISIPIAGVLAASFGVLLGIPVLRLRGDYLAIVTLGFGEIVRLVLENWDVVTRGPSGIPGIPKPAFFGVKLGFAGNMTYLFYIILALVVIAMVATRRLQSSRIGRSWVALREDEIACQAMGIDTTKAKLAAFGLGAFWAGIIGVFFAAKSSFVSPMSFTFFESAIILSIVVLGGMGSVLGVILAAGILILLPEYLRFMADYRLLIFGALMVVMMVFKPGGLITNIRQQYTLPKRNSKEELAELHSSET
ncbi:MAG: branched-chain amino acid ABC transporter permease [SAR324 cluster bacterium]|uniref:Branched-chain amino acid ABC transporter permease n=1 Tax=SAR324 cluster bacterium TaxID=2024889 RepID=A0A2A4STK1_9DELT|nr:MAG: branched-chain amino acid ABC transporter permease [SAR324 cluster bacterium]